MLSNNCVKPQEEKSRYFFSKFKNFTKKITLNPVWHGHLEEEEKQKPCNSVICQAPSLGYL